MVPIDGGGCSPNQDCLALGHTQLWSALHNLQPNTLIPPGWRHTGSRQSQQVPGVQLAWKNRCASFLLLLVIIKLMWVSALLSFPQYEELLMCIWGMSSWLRVSPTNRKTGFLVSHPCYIFLKSSLLDGQFCFHSKLRPCVKGEQFLNIFFNLL